MPSLQSIVNSWTKINHDHVEYHADDSNGLHPNQARQALGAAPGGVGGALIGPGGGGGSLLEVNNVNYAAAAPGIVAGGGVIDPRANTTSYASNTPQPQLGQPSLPSSSSLSSYSFSKGTLHHNNLGTHSTADTNSLTLTATPPLNSQWSAVSAPQNNLNLAVPPSQRYPLHLHHSGVPSASQPQLSQSRPHLPGQLPGQTTHHHHHHASTGSSSRLHRPSRRSHSHHSNHNSHHGSHSHHGGSALRSQLESHSGNSGLSGSSHQLDALPPPQAGADAILGRRKSNNNSARLLGAGDRSDSAPLPLGEPPASLSKSPSRGSLNRTPSSSLWHSTRSVSSNSNDSKKSSNSVSGNGGSGAPSVTASLDKMNIGLRNGMSGSSVTAATIAELNSQAENALQSMNNLTLKQQQQQQQVLLMSNNSPQQQQQQSNLKTANPINTNIIQNSNSNHLGQQTMTSMMMPIPQKATTKRGFGHRQRLRKSHSRTDLVREMALDQAAGRARKRSSVSTTASGATALARNGNGESDFSSTSGLQHNLNDSNHSRQSLLHGLHSGHSSDNNNPSSMRPQHRTPEFLATSGGGNSFEEDIGEQLQGGIVRSVSSSSADSDHGSSTIGHSNQPQQQQGGIGMALNDLPPLNSLGDMNRRGPQHTSFGELEDALDARNAGAVGAPGGHYMQGWFPNQPLPGQQRQNSGGSSDTAITGNRSLEKLNDTGGNSSIASSLDEQQPLTTTMNPSVSSKNAAPMSKQQQMAANTQMHGGSSCDRCAQMELTLLSVQADLEYLRTLELQREFQCKDCDNGSVHHSASNRLERMDSSLPPIQQNTTYHSSERSVGSAVSIGSRGSRASSRFRRKSTSGSIGGHHRNQSPNTNPNSRSIASRTSVLLRDASKRLSDLSTRHKRQVKQTTHERAYWQNDMHLKLEKFAMMCKNLNEEAAHRSNEVKETKALLDKMTSERNTLVSRVDTLKARVELYEEENLNQTHLREEWEGEKTRMLDSIDEAVKIQDSTADDLSSRLELAVETIENERKQQRMRRQIIFPSSSRTLDGGKSNGDASAPPSPHHRPNKTQSSDPHPKVDDLERIQKTKEVARKAQLSLQAAMLQSASREKAMQSKLESVERELAEARALMAATAGGDGYDCGPNIEMQVPLIMEPTGKYLRRASSSGSLGSINGPL